jgi:signal transduction histidine kinase
VSHSGGRVEIAVSTRDGWLVVDVRDQGPGIRPEHLSKVFDPFFSTKKRGTGLGLSISNRIVLGHGGRIEIQPSNHGTVIRVLVPLATPANTARSPRPAEATP